MISSLATVTATASAIVSKTANATRTIVLQPDASDIHIGGSDVTTTTGLVTKKDVTTVMVLPPQNSLYAVTATGTVTIRLMVPEGDF